MTYIKFLFVEYKVEHGKWSRRFGIYLKLLTIEDLEVQRLYSTEPKIHVSRPSACPTRLSLIKRHGCRWLTWRCRNKFINWAISTSVGWNHVCHTPNIFFIVFFFFLWESFLLLKFDSCNQKKKKKIIWTITLVKMSIQYY